MFGDKLKERLPPRSIRIIKHFFAKLFQSSTLIIRIDFAMAFRRSLSIASASSNLSNGMGTPLFGEFP
jgi:hypothetical protein